MICVLTTDDWFQAHILCGLLTGADIPAYVFDEGMVRMNWLQATAFGGYRLMVPSDRVAEAQVLLNEYRRGDLQAHETPPCPDCGSALTGSVPSTSRRAGFLSIFLLGFPIPFRPRRDRIACAACGAPASG